MNTLPRNRIVLITLFLLIFIKYVDAQNFREKVDENLTQLSSESDTVRFNAMINLATFYNFLPEKYDSVDFYAQRAYDLAQNYDIVAWKMQAYYYKGLYHQRYSSNLDSAIIFFTELEEIAEVSGRKEKLGAIYNALGVCWYSKGDYPKALEYYNEVLSLSENEHDIVSLANASLSVGSVYLQMGEHDKAIASMKEALAYNQRDTTPDQVNVFLNVSLNLIDAYINMDSLDAAGHLLENIESKALAADYVPYRDRFINQQLNYFDKSGQKEKLSQLAKEHYAQISSSDYILPHIRNTISYHYGKGLIEEGRIKEVNKIIQEMENRTISEQMNFKAVRYQFLYELNKGIGESDKALENLEKFVKLQDSLINDQNTAKLQEIFAQYEVEKKERKLKEVENDRLRLKRNVSLLIALLMALVTMGSLFYVWINSKRQKEKEEMYNIEQKMLSLQMNPHFIFNAISSIQNYLFDKGDTKKALLHLSTFSNLMRQILENSREKFIPLEEEIEFLNNYLKLQKLRYDDRFDYEIAVDPNLDVEMVSVPPLLTQPFVENAIEHGDLHLVTGGKVVIRIQELEGMILIEIKDNGIGVEAAEEKKSHTENKSLAIKITKERLDLLNKLMKKNFSMNISSSPSLGTSVELQIPTLYL